MDQLIPHESNYQTPGLDKNDNNTNNGNLERYTAETPKYQIKPDFWDHAAINIAIIFYGLSLSSTYISLKLLLVLSAGLVNVNIPLLGGIQFALSETVALMGTGVGEGGVLADAYLTHYKLVTGKLQYVLRCVRISLSFAQALLYYSALANLFFLQPDFSKIQGSGFNYHQEQVKIENSIMFPEPPTVLDGIFLALISGSWAFGTSFLIPPFLLSAIDSKRNKKQSQKTTITSKKNTSKDSLIKQLKLILEVNKEVVQRGNKYETKELKRLQQEIQFLRDQLESLSLNQNSDLDKDIILKIINNIPEATLNTMGLTITELHQIFFDKKEGEKINHK